MKFRGARNGAQEGSLRVFVIKWPFPACSRETRMSEIPNQDQPPLNKREEWKGVYTFLRAMNSTTSNSTSTQSEKKKKKPLTTYILQNFLPNFASHDQSPGTLTNCSEKNDSFPLSTVLLGEGAPGKHAHLGHYRRTGNWGTCHWACSLIAVKLLLKSPGAREGIAGDSLKIEPQPSDR